MTTRSICRNVDPGVGSPTTIAAASASDDGATGEGGSGVAGRTSAPPRPP